MARAFMEEVGGDDVLVGSVVADRYHVAGILGQGTTGTVFGVEHIHFGRRAAMKVLRPRSAQSDVVHRVFHGDARAAWSVSHPCIAEIFDVGTLPDGAPFFVMEYLEGETLAKRMARDRLSQAAAVDVMMQILSAIAAVHERALLVRDLRPQNVFLSHRRGCRPVAKILDLGLGRLTPLEAVAEQWEADAVSAAVTLPHPFYLSPERTRSEHGIDHASDLFVAGVIFYEMLTGKRPFSAPTYNGLLLQIAQSNPTPVSELRDHASAELDEFISRALSGNPRGRFATAKEMQDELRRIFETTKRGGASASRESTAVLAANANPAAAAANTGAHAAVPPSGTGPNVSMPPGVPGFMPSMPPAKVPLPPPPHASAHVPVPPPPAPSGSFRAARSGSGASPMASTMMAADPMATGPESPREQTLSTEAPTATQTARPQNVDDFYGDETDTNRKYFDAPYQDPASSSRMQAARPRFDEASADSPHRTVPPVPSATAHSPHLQQPPTAQVFQPLKLTPIDDELEEPTEARNQIYDPEQHRDPNKTPLPPVPEEETQQLQMTPEIRAKIEAHYAQGGGQPPPARPPMNSEMDSIPPPTKRLK
jgi:serine/threonine-protein kinase